MNNKDLFNAINDIDEKFIADAGEYLSDDDSEDPIHGKAVEILPGNAARFSPIKLAAAIAAAAVFISGVTIAAKHIRGRISIDPNTGGDASITAASGANAQGNGEDSETNLGTHPNRTDVGPLPFELIGPDKQQLWYEDLTSFEKEVTVTGTGDVPVEELTEDNWQTVTCGFAYYALPSTSNYNSVDNPEIDYDNDADVMMTRSFRRFYEGNAFGDLTVTKAYSKLKRETFIDSETLHNTDVVYLSENYIEFDGEITAEVYFVNAKDGSYYCVFRNGADYLPIVGYDMPYYFDNYGYADNNAYASKVHTFDSERGFKYSGDMPVLKLEDEEEIKLVERALSNANYIKATATFDNVSIKGTQDIASTGYTCSASLKRIHIGYVESVATDYNLFGETPFTAETEMQLRAILGCTEDISELIDNEEVKSLTGCTEIRVFNSIDKNGGLGEEITKGELAAGNIIVLFNNGERIVGYDYFIYDLVKRDV